MRACQRECALTLWGGGLQGQVGVAAGLGLLDHDREAVVDVLGRPDGEAREGAAVAVDRDVGAARGADDRGGRAGLDAVGVAGVHEELLLALIGRLPAGPGRDQLALAALDGGDDHGVGVADAERDVLDPEALERGHLPGRLHAGLEERLELLRGGGVDLVGPGLGDEQRLLVDQRVARLADHLRRRHLHEQVRLLGVEREQHAVALAADEQHRVGGVLGADDVAVREDGLDEGVQRLALLRGRLDALGERADDDAVLHRADEVRIVEAVEVEPPELVLGQLGLGDLAAVVRVEADQVDLPVAGDAHADQVAEVVLLLAQGGADDPRDVVGRALDGRDGDAVDVDATLLDAEILHRDLKQVPHL